MSGPTVCDAIDNLVHVLKMTCGGFRSIEMTVDADTFRGLGHLFGAYVKSGGIDDCRDLDRGVIEWNGVKIHRGK